MFIGDPPVLVLTNEAAVDIGEEVLGCMFYFWVCQTDVWHFQLPNCVPRWLCCSAYLPVVTVTLLPSLFGVLSFCREDSVFLVVGSAGDKLWVFVVWQYLNLDVGKIFFLCLNLMCPGFLFIKVCFHCPMTYTGFIRNLPSSVLLFICWQDLQIANPAAPFVIVLSPPSLLCLFDIWNTVIVAVLTSLLITTCQFGVDFGWFFLCGPYFSPFMPLMFGCSICEFYLVEY